MKNISFKIVAVIVIAAAVLSGCGLKKMIKKYETVKYEVTPAVLETHGGKISVTVKGNIPEKYFHKRAIVEFAPVLKYANGTTSLKSITLQGEKVKGAGTAIKKKSGGAFTYTDVIEYKPDMNKSELVVNAKASLKKKSVELGERKLADGVIYTSERIEKEGDIYLAEHGYEKETIITKSGEIYFAKAMSDLNLKTLPLNKDQDNAQKLKDFVDFLKNEWKIKNIDIAAWASPEGEETFNQGLTDRRSKTADKYIKDQIKDAVRNKAKANKQKVDEKKLDADMPVASLSARGEDWDGFVKAIGNSSIKEKNTILNVVNSQTDLLKKEKEINNMTVIYPEIEDIILPPLRRSLITINYFEPKKSDQEIAMLATTMPDSLKKEELLYAATLTENLNTKLQIYDAATKVYPGEWKGYNNAGYVCLKLGKIEEAASYLDKAGKLMPNNGIIINNLGVVALWKKEYDNAKSFFETAQGLGINEGFNMGPIFIKKGDYAGAISSYGTKTCTHNIALAQLLSGNSSAAAATLECADPKSSAVYYLMAIVGARTSNTSLIYENLPKAIAADASYRDQAKDDREFLKYNTGSEFLNAIK
ncbi:MAG: tetratricopeptide repeat protein [Bacteroidales bacterium]